MNKCSSCRMPTPLSICRWCKKNPPKITRVCRVCNHCLPESRYFHHVHCGPGQFNNYTGDEYANGRQTSYKNMGKGVL